MSYYTFSPCCYHFKSEIRKRLIYMYRIISFIRPGKVLFFHNNCTNFATINDAVKVFLELPRIQWRTFYALIATHITLYCHLTLQIQVIICDSINRPGQSHIVTLSFVLVDYDWTMYCLKNI